VMVDRCIGHAQAMMATQQFSSSICLTTRLAQGWPAFHAR
jgi:hypothetical protein